jgi:hypothetical protein
MARLGKAQIYAIQWLNSQEKSPIEIADELTITVKQVNSILEKSGGKNDNATIKTAKSPASRSQNLMIRETSAKKTNSVAIMTGEASMVNDSLKGQAPKPNQLPNTDKYIFRPKNK